MYQGHIEGNCTLRYFVQLGEATLAGLSYTEADIEDSPVVCMTRQAAIWGHVYDKCGDQAYDVSRLYPDSWNCKLLPEDSDLLTTFSSRRASTLVRVTLR